MSALFIGIGGTGDWILTYLKDKVHASRGEVPDTIQFRLIDTLAPDSRLNGAARLGDKVGISDREYLQLADDPPGTFAQRAKLVASDSERAPQMARWFKSKLFLERLGEADLNLVRGAGQHRQFGRMAAYLNRQQIVTMVRKALEQCRRTQGEVPIWIVGSLAGGTGAGVFTDVAALAWFAAKEMRVPRRILGVAVLPDVYSKVGGIDLARAYATLREIERFQSPVAVEDYGREGASEAFRFKIDYDDNTVVKLESTLFSNLVFYNKRCETETERRDYFSQIADGLNMLLDDSVGDVLFSDWINVHEGKAASFNSHRIFVPARLYANRFVWESVHEVVNGLLPRDRNTAVLEWGSEADRVEEAREMLAKQGFPFIRRLMELGTDKQFEDFNREMDSGFIVKTLLGFANPVGVFGQDIGDRTKLAERLWLTLCDGIEDYREVGGDYPDFIKRLSATVAKRRNTYEGDGDLSFQAALKGLRELVEGQVAAQLDRSLKTHLEGGHEQALGRTVKALTVMKDLLKQVRGALQRLAKFERSKLEELKGHETDARAALDDLKKPFFGKGRLPEHQDSYLDSVNRVTYWWQRMALVRHMDGLIGVADKRCDHWLAMLSTWQDALDKARKAAIDGMTAIDQELKRQVEIKSSSLGTTFTINMNGYQAVLRDRCTGDPSSGATFASQLLRGARWQAGASGIVLDGWPGGGGVAPRQFGETLEGYLVENIRPRMKEQEGIAKYLEWVRDNEKPGIDELVRKMIGVKADFVDGQHTSETRKFLLLHGDTWKPNVNRGLDEFTRIYHDLNGDPDFRELQHNLTGAEGINLFQDRNVLAILATDKAIDYARIPSIDAMRLEYLKVRTNPSNEWRVDVYHAFRCEQEIWAIERARVDETKDRDIPLTSGTWYRLLDEPERVKGFATALVLGVVREIDAGLDGRLWVCGPTGADNQAVHLTEPTGDLFRALCTFVQDKKDRRANKTGMLDLRVIKEWCTAALRASGKGLGAVVSEHRDGHPELYDLDRPGEDYSDPRRAFIALVLGHYLKQP